MKTLIESLLDNDEKLFDDTLARPIVENFDYLYYEQAWFDILRDIKETDINIKLYINYYLRLRSDWTFTLGGEECEYARDIFKTKNKQELYNYLLDFVVEKSEWYKRSTNNLIDSVKSKLVSKDKVISWLFYMYDGLFYKIYRSRLFSREPKTKEYYKQLKTILINKGMEFK